MLGHGELRRRRGAGGVADAPLVPLLHGPALRQVAVDRVVRGGLIGERVGRMPRSSRVCSTSTMLPSSATEIGLDSSWPLEHGERLVQRLGLRVDVAGLQALGDAALAAFDRQHAETRHGGGQRLRAAHAAETGRQYPLAVELAAEVRRPISAKVS
jgi:hypothetical protein